MAPRAMTVSMGVSHSWNLISCTCASHWKSLLEDILKGGSQSGYSGSADEIGAMPTLKSTKAKIPANLKLPTRAVLAVPPWYMRRRSGYAILIISCSSLRFISGTV